MIQRLNLEPAVHASVAPAVRIRVEFANGKQAFRVFCGDQTSLRVLLQRESSNWLSTALVYVPESLGVALAEGWKAANARDGIADVPLLPGALSYKDAAGNLRKIALSSGTLELLDAMPTERGPLFCVGLETINTACSLSPRRVNVSIGSVDNTYTKLLGKDAAPIPLWSNVQFDPNTVGVEQQIERELGWLESLLLDKCHVEIGQPRLPTTNYHDDSASYGRRPDRTLPLAQDAFTLADELAENLRTKRCLLVGGFGAGVDFTSRIAVDTLAASDSLFAIRQFTPRPACAFLQESSRQRLEGVALILRNLFDPDLDEWSDTLGDYVPQTGSRHDDLLASLVKDKPNPLLQLLKETAAGQHGYIVITTQCDTVDVLMERVDKCKDPRWGSELRRGVREVLKWFKDSDRFEPLHERTAGVSKLRATTIAVRELGRWMEEHEDLPPLYSHSRVSIDESWLDHSFRPALFYRLMRQLFADDSHEPDELKKRILNSKLKMQAKYHKWHHPPKDKDVRLWA